MLSRGRLVVATRTGTLAARVPPGASLAGALHVRGLAGVLLLVRVGSTPVVTDAVYRVTPAAVQRVHVRGAARDGLVQAGGAGTVVDFDCGRAPLTVDQISARPQGTRWNETVLTYALGARGLVLRAVRSVSLSGPAASTRRCAIVGR